MKKLFTTFILLTLCLFSFTSCSDGGKDNTTNISTEKKAVLPENLEHNKTSAVDAIIIKAKEDAKSITDAQSKEAIDFIKNNYSNYFKDTETMEYTMYYGALLEYSNEKNSTLNILGMDTAQVVKYVYRGAEKVEDTATQENLKQIKESLNKL